MPNLMIIFLNVDNMVRHHRCLHWMHPYRSSYLSWAANGSLTLGWYISWDPCQALCKTNFLYCPSSNAWHFLIDLPKMHGWFCIGLPKIHVLVHLNGTYGFLWSNLRLPNQYCLTRFPQLGISGVPWLWWKNSNKKPV